MFGRCWKIWFQTSLPNRTKSRATYRFDMEDSVSFLRYQELHHRKCAPFEKEVLASTVLNFSICSLNIFATSQTLNSLSSKGSWISFCPQSLMNHNPLGTQQIGELNPTACFIWYQPPTSDLVDKSLSIYYGVPQYNVGLVPKVFA